MESLFSLLALISFSISFLVLYHFSKELLSNTLKKRDIPLVIIGVAHLVFAVILCLWALNMFPFSLADYTALYSVVVTFQAVALVGIVYNSTHKKRALLPLFLYLVVIPFMLVNKSYGHMVVPFSLIIILLAFTLFSNLHKRLNQTPLIYSSVSLAGYIVSALWPNLLLLASSVSGLLFLIFVHSFTKGLRSKPEYIPEQLSSQPRTIKFLKHLLFIVILTNFVFIGTIGIHEVGHVVSAKLFDCENAQVIVEFDTMPHAETACSNNPSPLKLVSGALLLPLVFALFLATSNGAHMKEISLQIISFNFLISYQDFLLIGFSTPLALFIVFTGAVLAILSMGLLANARVSWSFWG